MLSIGRFLRPTVLLLALVCPATVVTADEIRGTLTVVGGGPERPVIEDLALAFEKNHVGTAVEIKWNRHFRLREMVMAHEADLAVAGKDEQGLTATTVAWDGLAVIVNFSNPIKEITRRDVAALFSGTIRNWSELDENAEGTVQLIVRPDDQNLTDGFERSLGIAGRVPKDAKHVRSDQKVLSRVSGQLDAVGYLSLRAALEAAKYGNSVRILLIDGVEPGNPTIQSGQYSVKRPVVFLSHEKPTALAKAFIQFALSSEGQRILGRTYVPAGR